MAPKNALSSSSAFRRVRAVSSSIRPADKSAVDRHLLARHGVEVDERAATSAIRPEPFVITTKFTMTRIVNTMIPMTKLAAHHEIAERLDDVSGGGRALMAVRRGSASSRRGSAPAGSMVRDQ